AAVPPSPRSTTFPYTTLFRSPEARRRLANDLVDTLVEIHAANVEVPALAAFLRPGNYNERQVRRFSQLWEVNQTRDLPKVVDVRSEEHTSELQSRGHLVCRLL